MKPRFHAASLAACALIQVGCASANTQVPVSMTPLAASSIPTDPAATAPLPSFTPTPRVATTAMPTETVTAISKPTIAQSSIPYCTDAAQQSEPSFEGTLLYLQGGKLFLSGGAPFATRELASVDTTVYDVVGFSPDGKSLLVIESRSIAFDEPLTPLSIRILSSTGEVTAHMLDLSYFEPIAGFFISGFTHVNGWYWINSSTVYAPVEMTTAPVGSQDIHSLPEILDPMRGEWNSEIFTDIPEFQAWNTAGVSPDTTRVLYEHFDGYLVLWDVPRHQALMTDHNIDLFAGANMSWAPDSSVVAYTGNRPTLEDDRRVFLVSRDGDQQRPITTMDYPAKDLYFDGLSWSNSGRYLALVGHVRTEGYSTDSVLYVYDRALDRLISQCPYSGKYGFKTFWSPDDSFVAIKGSSIELLELGQNARIRYSPDGSALGWTPSFPVSWPENP